MGENLNGPQREAVCHVEGPLLVVAGAGTGKTKVITSRVAHLISVGIQPKSIVAVSFTNKAAREMKQRLSTMVSAAAVHNVTLSTFHSFAVQLLRKHHKAAGLESHFAIANEGESRGALRETLKELGLYGEIPETKAISKISFFKDNLYTENEISNNRKIFDAPMWAKVFSNYNKRLRLYNCVDFDDLVYILVLLLQKNTGVLNALHSHFQYFMVDEFQDTSYGQFELIKLLVKPKNCICVVGDDDQSIYAWRGARSDIIFQFLKDFPNAKQIKLEENYRCSPRILNVANAVIAENENRLKKELWSQKTDIAPIVIRKLQNDRSEGLFIADNILMLQGKYAPHFKFENVAILLRSSSQFPLIEQILLERNIPCKVFGGQKFFDKKEIKDLFCYLKLANNRSDISSLMKVINLPPKGVGTGTLEKIRDLFVKQKSLNNQIDLFDILNQFKDRHKGICEFLDFWQIAENDILNSKSNAELIIKLRKVYEKGLRKDIVLHASNSKSLRYKEDLIERAFKLLERVPFNNLTELMDTLNLDEAKHQPVQESSGFVQLMTIHASKGLEFPYVFLPGLEDGLLPHERSLLESNTDEVNDLEAGGEPEERRLFYVAITRAKERLFITHCENRMTQRGEKKCMPSRFLNSIPFELTQWDEDPSQVEQNRLEAAKKLFSLFHS